VSTVPAETSQQDFTGNGATLAFPCTFPILDTSDLVVELTLSGLTVATLQTEGVHYTVDAAPSDAPTVTMVVAPPADSTLHVERTVPFTQEVNLVTAGPFSPSSHTRIADKLTMQTQQLDRRVDSLEGLGSLVPIDSFEGIVRLKTFTTHATAIESGFPITVALPDGFVPTAVWVVKVANNTDPADLFEEPVGVQWTAAALLLTIQFLTGLSPATNYTITLMMVSTAVT